MLHNIILNRIICQDQENRSEVLQLMMAPTEQPLGHVAAEALTCSVTP